jgi:molybdopterin-guanine dinucleotide biosynthesis protein A
MFMRRAAKYPASAIILSGGKSLRMGKNKAFIEVEGIPLIFRVHTLLSQIFSEIIVVANEREPFAALDAKIYGDLIPNRGALGGLYTGLFHSEFPHAFVVGCDMPYLKRALIQWMIERIEDYDVVVPRTRDGLEPLHAIYSKNCLKSIRAVLDQGKLRILDFYPLIRVRIVDETEFSSLDRAMESFINVNTPAELSSLEKKKRAF